MERTQYGAVAALSTLGLQPSQNDPDEKDIQLVASCDTVEDDNDQFSSVVRSPVEVTGPISRGNKRWNRRYRNYLRFSDFAIVSSSVVGAQFLRFGTDADEYSLSWIPGIDIRLTYTILSILLILGWMVSLSILGTRDYKIVGAGASEYKRIIEATIRLFGVLAIVDLLFRISISRGYLLISFPAGLLLLLISRWLWRKWLYKMRRNGKFLDRAVLVGESGKARHVFQEVSRGLSAGYKIVGAITDTDHPEDSLGDIVVKQGYMVDSIMDLVDEAGADTIILVGADDLGPKELRALGWAAGERGVELIVAPPLTDIAGPRIHSRPVSGLPLIHIEYPEITGMNFWIKRVFDVVSSAVLLLLLSPVLVVVAAMIKISSTGPIFYRQERIGQDGRPFGMLKFRSMIVGADAQLKALLQAQGTADKPLFKVENDPRITPIGKFIRRYSIDELPQLFNSLMGSMSLVGPRPQVAKEVELYDEAAFRRLMVKPGLTGLWQVSGRSDLSWEDAIRLDLYYVENWSLTGDLVILARTVRAVFQSEGAY